MRFSARHMRGFTGRQGGRFGFDTNVPTRSGVNGAKLQRIELDGPSADSDGDGLRNDLEFALGGDPTNPGDRGHSPAYTVVDVASGKKRFQYSYPRRSERAGGGLTYDLGVTTDLGAGPWFNEAHWIVGVDPDAYGPGFEAVVNHVGLDDADPATFVRLEMF